MYLTLRDALRRVNFEDNLAWSSYTLKSIQWNTKNRVWDIVNSGVAVRVMEPLEEVRDCVEEMTKNKFLME